MRILEPLFAASFADPLSGLLEWGPLCLWLALLFVLGSCVGSALNVCIYRLPLEKSLVWPGSRCGQCLQPIRWYDNIPLVSYWVLRGRCRACGAKFSCRYFLIELFTGLCFSGLFYLEVIYNIHGFRALDGQADQLAARWIPSGAALPIFAFHALLFCFLLVATCTDLDFREIPLGITIPGTICGLVGSLLMPWPWPWSPKEAEVAPQMVWWMAGPNLGLKEGVYPWPVWGPLPEWLPPGSWQLGLATGLTGALVGTLMLRVIRYLFTMGLGVEALGLGDADLMMMAGSFLGWQPAVAAFFVGVMYGLVFGIIQLVVRRDNTMAFGPALCLGIATVTLGWSWIGPPLQSAYFNDVLLGILVVVSCVLMFVSSYVIGLLKDTRGR